MRNITRTLSNESSSSESDEENSDTEESKDSHYNANQSGDESLNGGDPADMVKADDLLSGQDLTGFGDGNANEAEQSRSLGKPDDAINAPANQASMGSETSQA